MLRLLRRFNTTVWQGGLMDQPYLFSLELNAASEIESEFSIRLESRELFKARAGLP